MNPAPGDIYLVDLGMIGKVRPAVVVSREDPGAPRAIALCVPLTTQCRDSAYEVPLGKLRFLSKESWANVQALGAFGHEKLLRKLGRLHASQLEQLKSALRHALAL